MLDAGQTPDETRNDGADSLSAAVAMSVDEREHGLTLTLVVAGQDPPPGPQARSSRQRYQIHYPGDAFDADPVCLATRMVTRSPHGEVVALSST